MSLIDPLSLKSIIDLSKNCSPDKLRSSIYLYEMGGLFETGQY